MGATTVRLAKLRATFEPVAAARPPATSPSAPTPRSRFVQTTGGRTGLPAPRRVKHPPFVQFRAPTVWTTLALTIHADGTSSFEVLGASKFPRHWVYDADGKLAAKVGLADFKEWYRDAFGKHTPWGDAGLEGARHRGRDRARAPAVDHDHARRRQARDPHGQEGRVRSSSRATRATTLFLAPRRRAVGRSIDGEPSPRSAPARARRAGRARGRHPHRDACRPPPTCGSRWRRADQIDRDALARAAGAPPHGDREPRS